MIVSHSKRFVFFSFPKTGSESVREMLADLNEETVTPYREATAQNPFYSHMSPAEAQAAFAARGRDLTDYMTFTVTRNPFARLVSIYEMVMAVDGLEKLKRRVGLPQKSFSVWLAGTQPDGPGGGGRPHQRWRKFGTWSTQAWISDDQGNCLVDHVLRLEHLVEELPPVLDKLGLPAPRKIVHKNKRVSTDWRKYYDETAQRCIEDRYGTDLQRYHYTLAAD